MPTRRGAGAGRARARRRAPGDVEGTAVDVDADAAAAGLRVSAPALDRAGEGVTDAVTFSCADRDAGLYGLARRRRRARPTAAGSALGVLFAGREPSRSLAEGGDRARRGADWDELRLPGSSRRSTSRSRAGACARRRRAAAASSSTFEALSPPAELGGDDARRGRRDGGLRAALPRARDRGGGRDAIDGLGQRGHSWGNAGLGPDRAHAHASRAWLEDGSGCARGRAPGRRRAATPTRRSGARCSTPSGALPSTSRGSRPPTTATAASAAPGLELWVDEDDDYPRRGAGEVVCGSTLELGALRLDCAFFALAHRGPRGRRPLRRPPPRVIQAVISDFGGVLTRR